MGDNDILTKALTLLKSAIRKYEDGNIEGGNKDREEANRLFDENVMTSAFKDDMLYTEGRNFGIIYHVFESNVADCLKRKDARSLRKIVKLLKENKRLNSQFNTYRMLCNITYDGDAKEYVSEALKMVEHIPSIISRDANEKFIAAIRECGLNEMVEIPDDRLELYEAIGYVINNRETKYNISDYLAAKEVIAEHVRKPENVDNATLDECEQAYGVLGESFEEKLNEEERKMVESLDKVEDKEAYFNEKRGKAVSLLREQAANCDAATRDRLNGVIENVEKKVFSESRFIADMAEIAEIGGMFDEDLI